MENLTVTRAYFGYAFVAGMWYKWSAPGVAAYPLQRNPQGRSNSIRKPDGDYFRNKPTSVTGKETSSEEANAIFHERLGMDMRTTTDL